MTTSKHQPLIKLLSVILAFCLLCTGGSLSVLADVAQPDYSNLIVEELEEYRTEYSKTYLRNDGQLETVVSATPIHFKEIGFWVEYDNTLKEDYNGNYQNKKSPLKVNLPSENGNDKEISITKDDYSVSLKLVGAKNSKANKKVKEENKTSRKDKTAKEMLNDSVVLSDSATYTNALDNTDITYDVNTNSLKESIVLKSQPKKAVSYTYQIRTENLTPVLNDNGSVSFYDEQDATKIVFYIPAPFMFDSNDEYSYDIKTNLEIKNKKATLTYTPSFEWLSYYNRAYPVTIDPTINSYDVEDAYTYSATEKQNEILGFEDQLKVGKSAWLSSCDYFDTYIRFLTLPTLPDDAIITDASIVLQIKQLCGTWETLDIGAYQIIEEWENVLGGGMVTYTSRPDSAAEPGAITTLTNEATGAVNIDILPMAKDWYNNPEFNFGVKLSMENETENNWDSIIFHSKQSGENAPCLSVTYIMPVAATGIEIVKPENNTLRCCESSAYYNFNYNVFPANATNKEVIWTSSNESVATINEYGMLSELTTGTTIITATLKENSAISDSFTLTIEESPISELRIYGNSQLYINGTSQTQLYFTHSLSEAPELIYTSSNTEIASVDSNGTITTHSKVGTAYIIVQAKDYPEAKYDMMISVDTLIDNLPPNNTIEIGQTWQLSTVPGTVAGSVENKVFESTGNQGSIIAKTGGTEQVYVNLLDYEGNVIASQECYLTATGSLTINCLPEDNIIGHRDSLYLTVAENYTPGQLKWYSSDQSVATCAYSSTYGWKLQAHKPGVTILTAAYENELSGTAYVTGYATLIVSDKPVETVELWTRGNRTIFYSGESFSVNALIGESDAYYDATYWVDDETYLTREPVVGINYACSNRIRYKAKEVDSPVTTTVEVTIGGIHDYIDLTIKPSGVAIENIPEEDLVVGDTHTLSYNTYGIADFDYWEVQPGNESIISVQGNTLTALAPGTARIRAVGHNIKTERPYYSEFLTIKVIQLARSISITNKPTNNTLYKGDTHTLSVAFTPSNTTFKNVTWSSATPSVAVFTSGGNLSVVGYGKSKITVTSNYDPSIYDEFTLISPCGGSNYRDVSQHNMVLQDDAYYKCSRCDYRAKSPELQDHEILSLEDYLIVTSLQQAYVHVELLNASDNPQPLQIKFLQCISKIRRKNNYRGKYDYSDANLKCYGPQEFSGNIDDIFLSGNANSSIYIHKLGAMFYDMVVGYYAPNVALSQSIISNMQQGMNAYEFSALAADIYGLKGISEALTIANTIFGFSNTDITSGDYHVRVFAGFKYLNYYYSPDGKLKVFYEERYYA